MPGQDSAGLFATPIRSPFSACPCPVRISINRFGSAPISTRKAAEDFHDKAPPAPPRASHVAASSSDALEDLIGIRASRAMGQHVLLDKMREVIPFDGFILSGLDIDGYRFGTATLLATNLPPAFLEAYVGEEHIRADPISAQVRPGETEVSDDDLDASFSGQGRSARLAYLFDYFEVGPRTIFPLWRDGHCYGSLLLTRTKPFDSAERAYLRLIAKPLHAALSEPVAARLNRRLALTEGELRCLVLASQGLTSEEIAAASQHTFETVNSYLKSATKKLGAANRTHAVAEALRRNIIS